MTALAPTLQAFFTDRLIGQRDASRHTVAGYRDTWRLLLDFAAAAPASSPPSSTSPTSTPRWSASSSTTSSTTAATAPAPATTGSPRSGPCSPRQRSAIPSTPPPSARCWPSLPKRYQRNLVTYLTPAESDALAAACDKTTWTGRRDHAMIVLAVQAGLRISELATLAIGDVVFGVGAHVLTVGKGRRNGTPRCCPPPSRCCGPGSPNARRAVDPLFPTSTGRQLSRDAIERRISVHAARAARDCPSMRAKHVTAHTLRHSCAMNLLKSGNDLAVIALWLGHEQVSTTSIYLHADMSQKERAIARATPLDATPGRYRPPDELLAFLEAL